MAISIRVTNRIRTFLDHGIPDALRDSRWFMAPLFFVWCKGKKVREWMDFKDLAPKMSAAQLRDLYASVDSFAVGRLTDTNPDALAYVLSVIDPAARSLADIGSGTGYFLRRVQAEKRFDGMRLTGCDLMARAVVGRAAIVSADHEALPFADRAFDVVTCMHTLEHARDLAGAVAELKRIYRRQLIVVVPCQSYRYYTLDMHLQFFPTAAHLARALGVAEESIRRFGDDLVYVSEQTNDETQQKAAGGDER